MIGRLLGGSVALVLTVVAGCAMLAGIVFTGATAEAGCQPASPTPNATTPTTASATGVSGPEPLGDWTAEQIANATVIVQTGAARNIPPRGWVIALATAMQESDLINLGHLGTANDHDSLGLFQQRPSQGWGTPQQIMNPAYAAGRFYDKLTKINGWQAMPLTRAAQAVQRSAFPDHYAKHEPAAQQLATAIAARHNLGDSCVSALGWHHPVPGGEVVSGYRTAERPGHDGVDISAARGTTIAAAGPGVVRRVQCNAHLGGIPYPCDVDGSPIVQGCDLLTAPEPIISRGLMLSSARRVGR